jgi:16S rRNA (uracil1498-N3)-methyltransferase
VNTERMRANVVEAAEQCGILSIAEVGEPVNLGKFLDQRDGKRLLIFCDEAAEVADPIQALAGAREAARRGIDVLIGPEGGFAEEERALLLKQPTILRLALGPRIMRADTAAVAALAVIQAVLGDWAHGNH